MSDFVRDWFKIWGVVIILFGLISIRKPLISIYIAALQETITIEWYWFIVVGIFIGVISFI